MLDAIIIPTNTPSYEENIERAKRAYEEENKLNENGYFVISGSLDGKPLEESRRASIYRKLRQYGIKPSQISIEPDARSTMENIINSLEKIGERWGRNIGIVSYPGHLDRFETIFKRAKEEGVIDNCFEIHRIPTRDKETLKEVVYESLSGILNRYKLRDGVKKALSSEDEFLVKSAKRAGNYFLDFFGKKNI